MTSLVDLLDELRQRNVSLWCEDERLRYRAPKDALTAELLVQLKARKLEIITFLQQANTQHQTQLPPLVASNHQGPSPLSFAQQRLWFLQQLAPNSTSNNMPVVVRFEGELNIECLKSSLEEVVRRHGVLRSRFPVVQGQPTVVEAHQPLQLPLIDLRSLPAQDCEDEANRQATAEARQPFDLVNGPLLRLKLFWLKDREYLLIWNMHCIICDGASSDVFYQDLTAIYQAFVAGQPSPLPELPVQYVDFAHWQRDWLQGEILESQLSYWQRILEGNLPLIPLPFDYPRPMGVQSYRGDRAAKMLPLSLNQALTTLGQRVGATQFMILLAAFEVLLYRYSRQEDLLINVASAGRGNIETEHLLGFFSNTLLLRANLSGNLTFRELLLRVKQSSLDAFAHQDIPFAKVVEELQPEQRQTRSSLFQVKFALNPPWSKGRGMASVKLPDLKITSLFGYIYHGETKYDLMLVMREQDEGLGMVFDYNAEVFAADTIARMVEHFHTLLEGIVQNPDQLISTLPLLTAGEQQLLSPSHPAPVANPKFVRVHQVFEDQVRRYPDAIALTTSTQHFTYQDLNYQANQLAHYLISLGIAPGAPIALCIKKSVTLIVAQLAVLKAGGLYIPIDTDATQAQIDQHLTAAAVILTQASMVDRLGHSHTTLICLNTHQDTIQQQNHHNPGISAVNDVACILFKKNAVGVKITHHGIVHLAHPTEPLNLSAANLFLHWASPTSDVAFFEVFAALLNGSQLVLPPPQMKAKDLGAFIHHHQITTLYLPTRLFNFVIENNLQQLQSLQQCLIGGDYISAYHTQKALQALPNCHLFNTYHALENTGLTCLQAIHKTLGPQTVNQVGPPMNGTSIYILDPDLQPLPIGVVGDLYLGGARAAQAYLNPSTLLQKSCIPNPFLSLDPTLKLSEHLFRTGEQAKYLPDGSISINNLDRQVTVLGQNVQLGDIEITLAQHPQVQECHFVICTKSPTDQPSLVAYVVTKNPQLAAQELYEFLKSKLPSHLIPAHFVMLSALPLTSLGEVDLDQLPLPNASISAWVDIKVAAQNRLEQQLTDIWQQVLKIPSIGTTDNFFALGGNSLLAMNLAIKIEEQLGKTLPLASFFQAPTIRELVRVLQQDQDQTEDWYSLMPLQPQGTRPPLFCIHFILRPLTSCFDAEQPVYALRYGMAVHTNQSCEDLPKQVEELAAHYIQEMQRVQPVGPYHLMGKSFGGTIAFEMAQQLVKQGETVALLGIFDTHMWARPRKSRQHRVTRLLKSGIHGFEHAITYRLQTLYFYLKYKNRYTPHIFWDKEVALFEPYNPTFYPGEVILFNAIDQGYQDDQWLPLQWQTVVKTLQVYDLPGDHNSILEAPLVHTVVASLQHHLRTIEDQVPMNNPELAPLDKTF